ncbi:hypothetical protein JCM19039_2765 [Geomicrobium sp. JCM 19039]|nr:hypothetical protein JCM19039_2765 [Geomicrobium sp. JCM 19039]
MLMRKSNYVVKKCIFLSLFIYILFFIFYFLSSPTFATFEDRIEVEIEFSIQGEEVK